MFVVVYRHSYMPRYSTVTRSSQIRKMRDFKEWVGPDNLNIAQDSVISPLQIDYLKTEMMTTVCKSRICIYIIVHNVSIHVH